MHEEKFTQEHYKRIRELTSLLCSENNGVSLALTIDHLIEFVYSEKNGDKYFESFLRDSVLPKWIGLLEEKRQLKNDFNQQLTIREHCYRLSHVIIDIEHNNKSNVNKTKEVEGEIFSWMLASDWLNIASGIDYVSVITGYFDSSLMFCSSAREYEDERSNAISHLALQLTIFNFVWGSFETIVKMINPSKVPKKIKPRSSLIDKAIFFLKNEYEPSKPVVFYDETLYRLRKALSWISDYSDPESCFKISELQGISGVGINVVRRIRNQFAHGAKNMPLPGNTIKGVRPLDAILVELSTRIVLYTIQMLLLAYLKGRYFEVDLIDYYDWGVVWTSDAWENTKTESIELILRGLHINREDINEAQLPLFQHL